MGHAEKLSKWGYEGKANKIGWYIKMSGETRKRGVKETPKREAWNWHLLKWGKGMGVGSSLRVSFRMS